MIFKFGIQKELEATAKGRIPDALYQSALNIVKALEVYGADRNADEDDGGYVLILQNVQDIKEAADWHIRLDEGNHEHVNLVKCEDGDYINALFLMNNEFGVNVFLPKDIALKILLDDLEGENG